jgi:hypothetical protein
MEDCHKRRYDWVVEIITLPDSPKAHYLNGLRELVLTCVGPVPGG